VSALTLHLTGSDSGYSLENYSRSIQITRSRPEALNVGAADIDPLIIPPTYLKDFTPSIFQQLWKNCTDVLSTPKRLVFLGYSLPAADLHAQFIFRCGFHNQLNGRLRADGDRYAATGQQKSP
jgi:hypothetical protein